MNWRDNLPAFAKAGYRVVAWDARGYGGSDDYIGDLNFLDFSADLIRLLDHLGCAKAHLLGLSMGGRILQEFSFAHLDRVATLTLVSTRAKDDPNMTPEKRA